MSYLVLRITFRDFFHWLQVVKSEILPLYFIVFGKFHSKSSIKNIPLQGARTIKAH